jgi:hypothetical protein
MPAAMTFNSLLTDLQAYLERGSNLDPTVYDQLPTLINDAEREIAKKLKVQGFIVPVTGVMVAGTSVYQKPDRWRETISINYGAGAALNQRTQLFPRVMEYCRMYWPNEALTAPPLYYSDYNYQNWLITPTPDQAYPFEIIYYEQPILLDATTQTNWLTEYIPQTLRYRTLLECTPFLKNDERIPVWQGMYDQSIAAITGEDVAKMIDRTSDRKGS